MFTESDFEDFQQRGVTQDKIDWQLGIFNDGVPFVQLDRAATVGDGIIELNDEDVDNLIKRYDQAKEVRKIKFVPASGAASRMFKNLFEYLENNKEGNKEPGDFIKKFFDHLDQFAFYQDLKEILEKQGKDIEKLKKKESWNEILEALLLDEGLGYGNLPKGLLKFHEYTDHTRTPFEEHLYEAAQYAAGKEGVKLHFTVSPEHLEEFKKLREKLVPDYETKYGLNYDIGFSVQKPGTDTMAVDMENKPFREDDGSILFRPGGHGALIDNLNELDAEMIFIKNIDNVVPEKHCTPTIHYKKAIGGKLLEIRDQIFSLIRELDGDKLSVSRAAEIFALIKARFCYEASENPDFQDMQMAREYLKEILHRPIRVCGVVKNLGEPGGGPFWAPNGDGDTSLQIIESSQVDHDDLDQNRIFSDATHFNPVDLVCYVYDHEGNKFDLRRYIDHMTCFVSEKSKDGKKLKALELPGLWNGAMAKWLTIFIEVPVETFNPVKTVNDLLRPMHQ